MIHVPTMFRRIAPLWASLLTLGLLAGMAADKALHHQLPADAGSYHARVRAAAGLLPERIGDWIGLDAPVPEAGAAMLHANLLLSRQYHAVRGPGKFTFLLVQVADARDILGHYPPVCYPGVGWTLNESRVQNWGSSEGPVPGTVYHFTRHLAGRNAELFVHNFMVLPDGGVCPDMDGVSRTGRDYRKRFFGVAQFQIVFPSAMAPDERDAITRRVVEACRPLLEILRTGVPHDQQS